MPVTPSGDLSNSLVCYDTMLADCPSYRSILSAADAAAAQALTIWQRAPGDVPAPFAVLGIDEGDDEENGIRSTIRGATLELYLCWPYEKQAGWTHRDASVQACNLFGALRAEIATRLGTGAFPSNARRAWKAPSLRPANDEDAACWEASITFTWS